MSRARLVASVLLALLALDAASAQLRIPVIGPRGRPPPMVTIEMLQAEFAAQSGGTSIYFLGSSSLLSPQARATLAAQAAWLRRNPHVAARIEGHSDDRASRDQALAIGVKRAAAVRDFLVLNGVPSGQLSIVSWGKERPAVEGASEAARGLNRRVVTVLVPPPQPMAPPAPFGD